MFTFVLLIIITLIEKRNVYGLHLHGKYWVKTLAIIKAAKSKSVWNFARRINHSNVCKVDRNYDSRTQNRFNPLIDFWCEYKFAAKQNKTREFQNVPCLQNLLLSWKFIQQNFKSLFFLNYIVPYVFLLAKLFIVYYNLNKLKAQTSWGLNCAS